MSAEADDMEYMTDAALEELERELEANYQEKQRLERKYRQATGRDWVRPIYVREWIG